MDRNPHPASKTVSLCARVLARLAQAWAIGGAVFFLPGAAIIAVLGLAGMGLFGFAVLFPIGCTLWGAYLFYAAGAALRRGEPVRGRLAWAALATWNVLVVLSASVLWNVADSAIADWGKFVAEYSRVKRFELYLLVAALLHVVVNGAFLIAACFAPAPPRAGESAHA